MSPNYVCNVHEEKYVSSAINIILLLYFVWSIRCEDVLEHRDIDPPSWNDKDWSLIYVMPTESAYVNKIQKKESTDSWHVGLGYIVYHKLKVMMKKSMWKGLPQLVE